MLLHYMKMAVRQLLKYKFQTFVSMLCMGIGLTVNGYIKYVLDTEFGGPRDEIRLYITDASQSAGGYRSLEEKRVEGIENLRAATIRPYQVNAFVEGKPELPYEVNVFGMTPDLFRHSLSSSMERRFKIMAGRDSIGRNEVLVSNGLAKRIYGKESVIGKSITLVADAGGENDYTGRSYRIAGILNTGDDSELYVYAPLIYNADVVKIFADIADGYTAKEVQHALDNAGLKTSDNGTPISFAVIEANVMHVEEILAYIVVTIFSWLIFLIGFITFMKFMIQMFYTRQRELALRKCVGSKNKGLYMMLASEVTAMLACAFAVSCITSEVSFNYISYIYFGDLISFSSLIVAQLETTLIAFAISLVVILFPIMRLRKVDMKGAMLRRRQGKKMKNAMLALQFAISITFLVLLGVVLLIAEYDIGWLPDKLSASEQRRIISLHTMKYGWDEIRSGIEKHPMVEEYVYCNSENRSSGSFSYHTCIVGNDTVYSGVLAHGDPRYFEFFNISMVGKVVAPDEGNYVYVDRTLYERLRQNPEFDGTVTLSFNSFGKYQIAGVIQEDIYAKERIAYVDHIGECPIVGFVFLVDRSYDTYYYRIKERYTTDEAKDAFETIMRKHVPEGLDVRENIHTLYEEHMDRYKELYGLVNLMYMLVFVCLLVVVLSVYSSISLDAATRQKDIAIRKINGARSLDIIRHFIAPYLINYTITFVVVYPFLGWLLLLRMMNGNGSRLTSTTEIMLYGVLIYLITVGLLVLTTWGKIRAIMKVNPAEVVRRE